MIIGGAGGMAWTGEGGSIPGWRESYLHVIATGDSDIFSEPIVEYSAAVAIVDTAGVTVSVPDVSYFQISADSDGNNSCSLTIGDREKWSPRGTAHPNLFLPSSRAITVSVTTKIRGASRTTTVFNGYVSSYTEAIGRGGGSINVTCKTPGKKNNTYLWSEWYATQTEPESLTKYRTLLDVQVDIGDTSLPIVYFEEDAGQTISYYSALNLWITWDATHGRNSQFLQLPDFYFIKGWAAMSIKPSVTDLTDDKLVSINWAFKTNKFNTVMLEHAPIVTGPFYPSSTDPDYNLYPNGFYGIYEKSATTDIADSGSRGTIFSPSSLVDKDKSRTALAAQASDIIWDSLADVVSIQSRFEPGMVVGRGINFNSAKLNISGAGYISKITHVYSAGNVSSSMECKFRTIAEPTIYIYSYYYKVDKDEYEESLEE
jgi:hypothetical protein